MKKNRFSLLTLLTLIMVMLMNVNVLAAEPTDRQQPVVAAEITKPVDVAVPEVVAQTNDNEGIMPLAASGYAAGYTNNSSGHFTIHVTGSALWSSIRLKAWSFSNPSDVYITLYRPDGSVAISDQKLTLEQSITKTVSNISSGDWNLYYFVAGTGRGWIDCEF